MLYHSTRGSGQSKNFSGVLHSGLAGDGGLFVPDLIPKLNKQTLKQWKKLSYEKLAVEIISLFSGDCFTNYNFGEGFLMLKYPSCYFGDLVAWYPDFLPSEIIQVLASVWNLD